MGIAQINDIFYQRQPAREVSDVCIGRCLHKIIKTIILFDFLWDLRYNQLTLKLLRGYILADILMRVVGSEREDGAVIVLKNSTTRSLLFLIS